MNLTAENTAVVLDSKVVRLGQVDRPRRQRAHVRAGRAAARVRPHLQPGRRHLDQLPEAEIKDRFVPATLRDDRTVRHIWEAEGKRVATKAEKYRPDIAASGKPLFTDPVTIGFHSGKSDLTGEAMSVLNKNVVPQVQMAGGMYVRVEGNTDNLGDETWNQGLSERRAQAIVDYLSSRGVECRRMVARGNGSGNPLASNKTAEGRARNRRTEILFIPATAGR